MVLASLYLDGQVVNEDPAKAGALWAKACDLGGPIGANGCSRRSDLEYRTVLGQEVERNVALDVAEKKAQAAARAFQMRGFEIATTLCDQGAAQACAGVAAIVATPHFGLPADAARAQAMAKRAADLARTACDGGDRDACAQVRSALRDRPGATGRDREAALALSKQACTAGDPYACGEWVEWNHLRWVRQERAELTVPEMQKLALKSCDGGDTYSCARAAAMLRNGHGAPVDLKASLRLYEKVCFATGEYCDQMVEVQAEAGGSRP
jgi:TPR repeat protein